MKNPITHTFRVIIWSDGFCWKNPRWEYNPHWKAYLHGLAIGLIIGLCI